MHTIKYVIPATNTKDKVPLPTVAQETATPGLLVTQSVEGYDKKHDKRPRWHVTHAHTGMKLTGNSVTRPVARLIAGALGGLPIDWTQADKEYFYKSALDLPSDVKHWLVHSLRH